MIKIKKKIYILYAFKDLESKMYKKFIEILFSIAWICNFLLNLCIFLYVLSIFLYHIYSYLRPKFWIIRHLWEKHRRWDYFFLFLEENVIVCGTVFGTISVAWVIFFFFFFVSRIIFAEKSKIVVSFFRIYNYSKLNFWKFGLRNPAKLKR